MVGNFGRVKRHVAETGEDEQEEGAELQCRQRIVEATGRTDADDVHRGEHDQECHAQRVRRHAIQIEK